jgi:hypothetical protein
MLFAPILIVAVQAAIFAPPLDTTLRIVTEREQPEGADTLRFRSERLIRFSRDGVGYRADVVVLTAKAEAPRDVAAMFESGYSGLAGRVITFRLDGAGRVVAIDQREAVWDAFSAGVAALAMHDKGSNEQDRAAMSEQIAGPLRALPADRQLELLASLVSAVVAEEGGAVPGVQPVQMPGSSPFGGALTLTGTRSIAATEGGLRNTTRAAADALQSGKPVARVELENVREIDTGSGLLRFTSETVRTRMGEGDRAILSVRVTTLRVELAEADAWPGN